MARITVEDCLDKVENRFALVLLVAKRSKQLLRGDQCLAPGKDNKYIVNSLREVAAGSVFFNTEDPNYTAEQQIEQDLIR